MLLGTVDRPKSVHQAKFSMGTTLGLIAATGRAGMAEFAESYDRAAVAAFRDRVTMVLDEEVDAAYPARWIGKVRVRAKDGRTIDARVDEPKGDPGNTLSRAEVETKVTGLACFSGAAAAGEMAALVPTLWRIGAADPVGRLLPPEPAHLAAAQ